MQSHLDDTGELEYSSVMPDTAIPQTLKILVVDDEINIRKTLSVCLETEGHNVVAVSNFEDAVSQASARTFELAFIDLRLGTADGLDLIPALLAKSPALKIIVITAYASIDTAVEAMRRGATDYVPKPFTPAQVKLAVSKITEILSLERKISALQQDLGRLNPELDVSTDCPKMQQAIALARKVAATDATVLLRGESGTGKTALARMIHSWSNRSHKPFGAVSCPTLSSELLESELFGHIKGAFTGAVRDNPGRIASCEGGTLLLDEIGDVPLSLQPKLLRFIQDREYEHVGEYVPRKADVRVIAATNINLERAVEDGRFREDLFYRLNVIEIEIPPLRERQEDIEGLTDRLLVFFGRCNHRLFKGCTSDALNALKRYSWPGNIRELRNVIERAAILCPSDMVTVDYLPSGIAPSDSLPQLGDPVPLKQVEQQHIRRVLAATKSLQEAADVLGIDQATLWRKRKEYGI